MIFMRFPASLADHPCPMAPTIGLPDIESIVRVRGGGVGPRRRRVACYVAPEWRRVRRAEGGHGAGRGAGLRVASSDRVVSSPRAATA
jgi:hypothetical protein